MPTRIPETLTALAVPLAELTPYERNPRIGNLDVLKESLQRHGQYRPIVVRKGTGEILAGNHTYLAAKALKWAKLAVTYVDVDDDEAARIVLVDNRASDAADYDDQALTELLQSLPTLQGTGYGADDLDLLLAKVAGQAVIPDELDPPGDAPQSDVPELWAILVEVSSEQEQVALLERFEAEGLSCRALLS